jgi:putative tryptophan/tyrosine transport system substrate-binding protein
MRRREFITLLGGAAATWPLAAGAQQSVRRVGVLMLTDENDPFSKALVSGIRRGLQGLGWTDGANMRMEIRWAGVSNDRIRAFARELIDLHPNVIVTNSGPVTSEVQRQTQSVPIIFVGAGDPVASGLVKSLPRPEGNTTGFAYLEPSIGSKWLELLKEAVPRLARVAFPTANTPSSQYLRAAEGAAAQVGVTMIQLAARSATELERVIEEFATQPGGALMVSPAARIGNDEGLIRRVAERFRLPAIYYDRFHVFDGGLMSYGPDTADMFQRAASYADRVLRGAKPGELPVVLPAKFELVINLKAARVIGLEVPPTLLARADEVIE